MAASAASTTTWERTGEPVNAFSGLGRGRGYRGRGGHRGGRGSSRTTRGQTTEDHSHTSKIDTPPPQPTTPQPSVPDVLPVTSTAHSKAKPPRKPSRGDPPPLRAPVPQARSSNRSRRSQVSKSSAIDPKLSPAASTDSQHAPASGLTKDPPPHLKRQVDVRQDIDALVERVRAVAMDNRPTTPGSHIDWAGDDDDTLPDLNDWGVNTSSLASGQSETISPIILEGLKPLPVISAPMTPSPLRRAPILDNPATSNIKNDSASPPSKPDAGPVAVPIVSSQEQPFPPRHVRAPSPSNQKSWHPSLPPKPPASSLVPRVNLRPVATPMRHPIPPKSVMSIRSEGLPQKKSQRALEQVAVESTSTASPMSVEVVSAIVKLADEDVFETSNTEARANSPAIDRPDPTDALHQTDFFGDDDSKAEGLEASIHAPKTPALNDTIVSHPTTAPRSHRPYKKEPTNQHPPLFRNPNGYRVDRFKQWNEPGLPPRNPSSSSTAPGPPTSHHRIHGSRPVITGDAMSRLARTIGQTNSAT